MFIFIATWIYILAVSYIIGVSMHKLCSPLIGGGADAVYTIEVYVLTGLVCITVYAQSFSLLGGLGMAANIILAVIALLLAIFFRNDLKAKLVRQNRHKWQIKLLIVVAVAAVFAMFAIQTPRHYDTYLYHAQAIRWIEEYGVVPGLGNLHNRFAYNSSFLVLQALFSFKFIFGISLHQMNGFIAVLFLSYSILSLKICKHGKLYISDALRAIMMLYITQCSRDISSPDTDTFALCLVIYIFIKWASCLEENKKDIPHYAYLCLLGIFGCTLKLSSAFLMLLLVQPMVMLIKGKKWKYFLGYIIAGIIIALPFVIRNVIISGYVLYPYPSLDIIPFIDWKMNPATVNADKMEIMVWGRATYDTATYDWSILKWLPIWFKELELFYKISFVCSVISSLGVIITAINYLRKKEYDLFLLHLVSVVCLLGWLYTAPLVRYGKVYMWIPCCLFFAYIFNHRATLQMIGKGALCAGMFILMCREAYLWTTLPERDFTAICNYNDMPSEAVEWEGYDIYVASENDQTGYSMFPSTPSKHALDIIELRGDELKDGFRLKKE